MKNIPFTNNTPGVVHIGTKTLFPGETREVDPNQIPNHLRDIPAPVDTLPEMQDEFDLDAFMAGTVDNIRAQLPVLILELLNAVQAAEESADKPRKGVLAAIAEERLRRASQGDDNNEPTELEQFAADLRECSESELIEFASMYDDPDDEAWLALVIAEQERRAAAAEDAIDETRL